MKGARSQRVGCYIGKPETASVYWLIACLFLHSRLRSVSSKAHWHQTQNFKSNYFKYSPNKQIFSH